MNKQKLTYLSPETETFVVQAEGSIMVVSDPLTQLSLMGDFGASQAAGRDLIQDEGFDF